MSFNIFDISLYEIQLFITCANEKSFSRVAELQHVSQPTLSKRIMKLEETLGFALFDRKSRPIEMTKAGAALYAEWTEILSIFEQSLSKARDLTGHTKLLNVGIIDSARDVTAFTEVGRQLEEQYEGLNVVREYKPFNRWWEMIVEDHVDIMFVLTLEEPFLNEEVESKVVYTCPKLVAMLKTNKLSDRESITYEDLKDQYFIINSPTAMRSHYEFIRSHTLKHGYEPKVARYTLSPHDLIGCLNNDNEVAIGDVFLREIDSNKLKVFELPDTYSGMMAVWKKDNENSFIPIYVDAVEAFYAEHPVTL